jgi:hypothetical protein
LIGTIVDNFTAPIPGKAAYLIPLGLIYIVPFFISIGLFFIPESPRWLMEQGKVEKARKSLHWLRPNKNAIESELVSIQTAMDESKENSGKALFFEMFRGPVNRRRTILAVAAVNTQAASGAMCEYCSITSSTTYAYFLDHIVMIAYGTYFFTMAGVGKPFENAVILVAVGVRQY